MGRSRQPVQTRGDVMRWEEERYVRVYTRDTPDWIALPWQARATFYELLRKVDRAGIVPMGRSGERGLAALLMLPFDVVSTGLAALLEDGCLVRSGTDLVVRRYIEAQEARQSDRARQRDSRERARAKAVSATAEATADDAAARSADDRRSDGTSATAPSGDEASPSGHAENANDIAGGLSQGVTSGHQASPAVTNCHSVPSRTVPSRAEQQQRAGAREAEPEPDRARVLRYLRAHRSLRPIAEVGVAERVVEKRVGNPKPWPLVEQAIADLASKAADAEALGSPWSSDRMISALHGFIARAQPHEDTAPPAPPRSGPRSYAPPEPVRTGTKVLTFDADPRRPEPPRRRIGEPPPAPTPAAATYAPKPGELDKLLDAIGRGPA